MIKTEKLSKIFRTDEVETTALDVVSFHVKKGDSWGMENLEGSQHPTILS